MEKYGYIGQLVYLGNRVNQKKREYNKREKELIDNFNKYFEGWLKSKQSL